ncbi:MAG: hypothetical protein LIO77_07390 [Rikenellaceae bacterium]|nr:hypothetical protein [Rikenellaceae bacterium]
MKRLFFYPALILVLVLSACSDDDPIDPPFGTDGIRTTEDYFQSNFDDLKQEFTIDMSEAPVTIKGKDGIQFTILPGTFTVGGKVVEGKVDIELYEMMSLSAIALTGTNTNYEGTAFGPKGYLRTDGFFYINAYSAGTEVDGKLAEKISVSLPHRLRPDNYWTMLWYGTDKAGDNGDGFAWLDAEDDMQEIQSNRENFEFEIGQLGWANCDIYENGQHTLTIVLSGQTDKFANFRSKDSAPHILFCEKDGTILAQMTTLLDAYTVQSYDNSMPDNITGRIFAVGVMDGVYTYAEEEITITGDMTVTLMMEEVTADYIDSRLQSLDGYY